jgi:hypothetical protein
MQNLMMQTASQMLNRAVMSRVKAIATGQPETVAELIDETTSVVEEPVAETTPVEAAVEPEAETAEGAAPTEEKPAEA